MAKQMDVDDADDAENAEHETSSNDSSHDRVPPTTRRSASKKVRSDHDRTRLSPNELSETIGDESITAKSSTGAPHGAALVSRANLDKKTLGIIKDYLLKGDQREELDEEEVAFTAIKTSQYSNERSRYRRNLLEDSDLSEEETYYDRVYSEEENYALANEFFRNVVNEAEIANGEGSDFEMDRGTVTWLKKAAGLQRPYDPRVKNARLSEDEDDGEGVDEEMIDGPKLHVPGRRLTRGVARATRVKRRQDRIRQDHQGIHTLLDAIEGLEKERGPFPKSRRFRSRRKKHKRHRSEQADHDDDMDNPRASNKRKSKGGISTKRHWKMRYSRTQLVARFPDGEDSWRFSDRNSHDVLVSRVVVNGSHFFRDSKEVDNALLERKRQKDREYQRAKREREIAKQKLEQVQNFQEIEEELSEEEKTKRRFNIDDETSWDDVSSAAEAMHYAYFDHSGELRKQSADGIKPMNLSAAALRKIENYGLGPYQLGETAESAPISHLPRSILRQGFELKVPSFYNLRHHDLTEASKQQGRAKRISLRHSSLEYATMCKRLMNSLNGGAARWAICEFFYSDLDRPWYSFNGFGTAIAKIGVRPNMKFTRLEWSAIRRSIPNRPRRFSKNFVLRELHKRNHYRKLVRGYQRHPSNAEQIGYDIPAQIAVGAIVSAFNKRLRLVQRGSVLFHDTRCHGYLILFERKELGTEFCPDSEVSTHGIPQLIASGSSGITDNGIVDKHVQQVDVAKTIAYGTMIDNKNMSKHREDPISRSEELIRWVESPKSRICPSNGIKNCGHDIFQKALEREVLANLMSVIRSALSRKSCILQAIKQINIASISDLPFGEEGQAKSQNTTEEANHYAWLIANLEATNRALQTAQAHLRIMYGAAYSEIPKLKSRSYAINKFLRSTVNSSKRSSNDSSGRMLALNSCRTNQSLAASKQQQTCHAVAQEVDVAAIDTATRSSVAEAIRLLAASQSADDVTVDFNGGLSAHNLENTLVEFEAPSGDCKIINNLVTAREVALLELKQAVALLNAETDAYRAVDAIKTTS